MKKTIQQQLGIATKMAKLHTYPPKQYACVRSNTGVLSVIVSSGVKIGDWIGFDDVVGVANDINGDWKISTL